MQKKLKFTQEMHIYRDKNQTNEAIPAHLPARAFMPLKCNFNNTKLIWLVMAKVMVRDGWPALPDIRHCPALP